MEGTEIRIGRIDGVDLIGRICHELGNLLAATRLSGYVLTFEDEIEQTANMGEEIEGLAVHAASLVHLLSVVAVGGQERVLLTPKSVLENLVRALPNYVAASLEIDEAGILQISEVSASPQVLANVFLALMMAARNAAKEARPLYCTVRAVEQGAEWVLEDRGCSLLEEDLEPASLRGLALVLVLAQFLLSPQGGTVSARGDCFEGRGARVAVRLPFAK